MCEQILRRIFAGTLLLALAGCQSGAPPKAAVSDVAVFTTLHLLAAEASTDAEGQTSATFNNGPFTAAQMRRYFETQSKDYPNVKTHADDLLDGIQSQSAIFQAAQSQMAASLAATLVKGATTQTSAATQAAPSDATTQQLEADAKAAFASLLSSTPNDSPFDQLDRVADFYASYVIKNLRVRGDSRIIDPDTLANMMISLLPGDPSDAKTAAGKMTTLFTTFKNDPQKAGDTGDRFLLIIFQAQIDPGTQPNIWTGIRLKIVEPKDKNGKDMDADQIRVIRVHPTHTYDLDMQTFGQSTSGSLATAFQGSGSTTGGSASATASQSALAEEQERKRFLSRITETASFADAAEHRFGFNFYPTNVKIEKSHNTLAILTGNAYDVKGYLEGGARDCAAMLLVPRSLASFKLDVSYAWGDIDKGQVHTGTFTSEDADPHVGSHTIKVMLPEWTPVELLAATIGAGPTTRPAAAATTRPATPATTQSGK